MATLPFIQIGRVVRAIGLKGFLGVAGADRESSLQTLRRLELKLRGERLSSGVEEARVQGKLWAVKLGAIGDRTAAEQWVGSEVWAERAEMSEPNAGRFFWGDLKGLPVVTVAGAAVGSVAEFFETGGTDVLVVRGSEGETLIPLAPYVTVDLEGRRIVIDPPEGLLDVDSAPDKEDEEA